MNNFISTFEELNKLYEEAPKVEIKKNSGNFGRKKEEACIAKSIAEAADNEELEIIDDETLSGDDTSIEELNEEEPRQVICECDKCGALVIKDEADIVVDEETDLVNVEDACQFCDEAGGYKIVGVVAPYEAAEAEDEVVEESIETNTEDQEDLLDEDLDDWYRKKFNKPASTRTQQGWEDELVDLKLALEDETDERKKTKIKNRIKQLENKFAQQRAYEDEHPEH